MACVNVSASSFRQGGGGASNISSRGGRKAACRGEVLLRGRHSLRRLTRGRGGRGRQGKRRRRHKGVVLVGWPGRQGGLGAFAHGAPSPSVCGMIQRRCK